MGYDKDIVEAINQWFGREYEESFTEKDIKEDGIAYIAYTTSENCDEQYELNVAFSLKEMCWLNFIDDKLIFKQPRTKEEFISELKYCDFGDIMCDLENKCEELHPEKEGGIE